MPQAALGTIPASEIQPTFLNRTEWNSVDWIIGFDEAKCDSLNIDKLTTYAAVAIRKSSDAHKSILKLITKDSKKIPDLEKAYIGTKIIEIKRSYPRDFFHCCIAVPKFDLYALTSTGSLTLISGRGCIGNYIRNCISARPTINEGKGVWCAYTLSLVWNEIPHNAKTLICVDDWNGSGVSRSHNIAQRHFDTLAGEFLEYGIDRPRKICSLSSYMTQHHYYCHSLTKAFAGEPAIAPVVQACGYLCHQIDSVKNFSIYSDGGFSANYANSFDSLSITTPLPRNGSTALGIESAVISRRQLIANSTRLLNLRNATVRRGDIYTG